MSGKILIIVENLPVPFDTRVWQEATTLAEHGYTVSVISPKGKGYEAEYERLNGVHIYRHDLPAEGSGFMGYVREYGSALYHELRLARKIYKEIGFDVIQGCNPPDDIYMIAKRFRRYGVRYVFDHHDICPELFEAKFGKKGALPQSGMAGKKDLSKRGFCVCDQRILPKDRDRTRRHGPRQGICAAERP